MSSVLKKADKLNLSLSLSLYVIYSFFVLGSLQPVWVTQIKPKISISFHDVKHIEPKRNGQCFADNISNAFSQVKMFFFYNQSLFLRSS